MNATQQPEVVQAQAVVIADKAYDLAIAVEVDSPEMFQLAGEELKAIKKRAGEIEDLRLSLTRPLDESKRRIMDLFRKPLDRLAEAETMIRGAMMTFQTKERDRIDREQREAEEARRREQQRLAEERRAAEEEAARQRQEAEAARASGNAEAAAAAEQAALEAAQTAEAAQAEEELAEIAPPAVIAEAPKAVGISTRQTWKHEVQDLDALIIAAAEGLKRGDPTLRGYLQANEKAIGQVARALKNQTRIPGVRVYAEDGFAVRAA